MKIAVVAHSGKSLGGGLLELRRLLEPEYGRDLFWAEVPKSRKAPREVRRALKNGADLVFAWGGDGMVQRCVEVLAGTETTLAVIPAGTANLFATNLGIPKNLEQAVTVGLHGVRRRFDVGNFSGERFAVMAGAGFDAAMIKGARGLKNRFGRAAYILSSSENFRLKPFDARIKVDGATWYKGSATCILFGNVGKLFGGVEAFQDARPNDGLLEVGVVTAHGPVQWARTLSRVAIGSAAESPFVQVTKARLADVKLSRKVIYELDGSDRGKVKAFRVEVEPSSVTVCVPQALPSSQPSIAGKTGEFSAPPGSTGSSNGGEGVYGSNLRQQSPVLASRGKPKHGEAVERD